MTISLVGFALGWLAGRAQAFAKHKWIGKLGPRRSLGAVTAYVMTNIIENNCVPLYEGQQEGRFSCIVLSNCRRFFLELSQYTAEDRSARRPVRAYVGTKFVSLVELSDD